MTETLVLEPWEWAQPEARKACIEALVESFKKKGFDALELAVQQNPDHVLIKYRYPVSPYWSDAVFRKNI